LHEIGYKDKVSIGEREFHIQTGSDSDKNRLLSEVFEKGRFIFSFSEPYSIRHEIDNVLSEDYLKSVTYDLHASIQEEIQLLFNIQDRLETMPQAQPHYRLGKVFFARNFLEEARRQFTITIERQPEFLRAYKYLGLTYLKLRQFNAAAEVLLRANKQKPNLPDILDCLGVVSTQIGDYENAKNFLQEAISLKANLLESNFNLGVVLFLSTLNNDADDNNIVIPTRILRAMKQIRELENYQDDSWQSRFERVLEIFKTGKKKEIISAITELQLQITTREDLGTVMDFFFLKFMFGGRELNDEEMEFYEKRIYEEASKRNGFADYWNELGIVHLIQCRDYFLKALREMEKAVEINPKYESAQNTLELMKHSKKGFLILLRALLK
jgi:tetratricopeptide (TPR) repeat protein